MSREVKVIAIAVIAIAVLAILFADRVHAEDAPVLVPSTCEEPIYQETPGATVPASPISPYCTPTAVPTNTLPSPVANTPIPTAEDGTVTELPGTGTGHKSVQPLIAALLGIALVFIGGATYIRRTHPSR